MSADPSQRPPHEGRYAPSERARLRRSTGLSRASRRRLSAGRRLWYGFLTFIAMGMLKALWSTCRVRVVAGSEVLERLQSSGQPAVITYWHQMIVFASWCLFRAVRRGLDLAFLTSPSVSGEIPATLIRRWGALPLRGSSTRASGEALRELYLTVTRDRRSLVITPDGPKGPMHEFKPGAVLIASMAKVPIVPVAWAGRRVIRWPSWDRFLVPVPFTTVAVAIGEPWQIPADFRTAGLEKACREMERRLAETEAVARRALD